MKKVNVFLVVGLIFAWVMVAGCEEDTVVQDNTGGDTNSEGYTPGVTPADFVTGVNNPYFPLNVGEKWLYEGMTDEGFEQIIVEVLNETRIVWGVEAMVVRDTVYVDGEIVEDTWDWFAQDKDGNVWYLGEETYEYEDEEIVNSAGAWEAGVDSALPGIIMPANPQPGMPPYYQEYYEGIAEDMGEVLSVTESVTTAAGSFSNCVKTRDFTPLEPDVMEFKYYCKGVGMVLEEEDTKIELVNHIKEVYDPGVTPDDFTAGIHNAYFPLTVGATWVYEGQFEDGLERIEVEVMEETEVVAFGVTAAILRDTAYMDGEIAEDTWDWFASDKDGNIWYLGEDTFEFEDGEIVSNHGAWEAGVDGALPGIAMPASPSIGDSFFQEYYIGEAEDMAEVLSLTETVTVPAGTWEDCIKTRDYSAIDPTLDEFKYWCKGVGLVKVEEGDETLELIEYAGLE